MEILAMKTREIGVEQMRNLILAGAGVVEFQTFLGGLKQLFKTAVIMANGLFISYHSKPFEFIRQPSGKIVTTLPPVSGSYHQS